MERVLGCGKDQCVNRVERWIREFGFLQVPRGRAGKKANDQDAARIITGWLRELPYRSEE